MIDRQRRDRVPIVVGTQVDREKRYSHVCKFLLTLISFRVACTQTNNYSKLHSRETESPLNATLAIFKLEMKGKVRGK